MKKITLQFFLLLLCICAYAQSQVGAIEGFFSTSPTGGAVYTIPIKNESSGNDFVPHVSLVYNSSSGNSIAGMGWNISGLSAISAVPHSRYFDESDISGINLDCNDAYSLDGQRLILRSGSNGRVNAEYVTENDCYCKIYIDDAYANTPKSFTVKKPDGTVMRYGSTSSALFRNPSNQTEAFAWLMDYVEDKDGNYISYNYTYYDNVPYITSIQYGGNVHGIQPTHSLNFIYANRTDATVSHIKGNSLYSTQKLIRIECKYSNTVYKKYALSYDNVSYYSHLLSVKEYGSGSAAYPATTFCWDNLPTTNITSESIANPGMGISPSPNCIYVSGDTDNDGKTELIEIEGHANGYSRVLRYKWNGSNFEMFGSPLSASSFYDSSDYWKYKNTLHGGVVAHFGRSHDNTIVLPTISGDSDNTSVVFEFVGLTRRFVSPLQYTSKMPAYTICDFDKDGLDEIVYVEKKHMNNGIVRLVTISVNLDDQTEYSQEEIEMHLSLNNSQKHDRIEGCLAGDFDGDGLLDLLVECSDYSIVFWNENGTFTDDSYTVITNVKYGDTFKPANLNDDDLVDLIIHEGSSTTWKKAINTGVRSASLFSVSFINNLTTKNIRMHDNDSVYACIVQDFNADGLSDLFISYLSSATSQKCCWAIAQRNGSFVIAQECGENRTLPLLLSRRSVQGDFNGDGYVEFLAFGDDIVSGRRGTDNWRFYKGCSFSPSLNKITSITDGFGKCTSITYSSLLDDYYNGNDISFPLMKFYAPIPVVSCVEETWREQSNRTSYKYGGGVMSLSGKGFLGFTNLASEANGLINKQTFGINTNLQTLYLETEITTDANDDGINYHLLQYEFSAGDVANSYKMNLSGERIINRVANTDTYYGYSNFHYGSPGIITTNGVADQTTTISYIDYTNNGKWVLCLPQTIDVEHEVQLDNGDIDNFYERTVYSYDSNMRISRKQEYKSTTANLNLVSTESYQYDVFGNQTRVSTIPYSSSDSLVTTFAYDSYGRLQNKTLPDGHAYSYSYNSIGRLLSTQDSWFNTSNDCSYDAMGRQVCIVNRSLANTFTPEITSISYTSYQSGNYAYKVTTNCTNMPTTSEYYDGFGRNVASGTVHFDGREFVTDRRYSDDGLLQFESVPHLNGTAESVGTTYEYDSFQRPVLVIDPSGNTVENSYSDGYKQTTVNGVTTEYDYNADGLLISKFDEKGEIDYFYNARGDYDYICARYENEPDVIIEYSYDNYGRLKKMKDSNGTNRNYLYDEYGRLSYHSYGSKTDRFYYNKYGDLVRKIYKPRDGNATALYTYDEKRQLTSVTGSGFSESYTYNDAGMLTEKTRSISYNNQTHSRTANYAYSGQKLSSISNTLDGVAGALSESYTYSRGWLTDIKFNDRNVWHLIAENSHGQTEQSSDRLSSTSFTYDGSNRLMSSSTSIVHPQSGGYETVANSYQYDCYSRIAQKNGKSYSYDSYNQLSEWNGQTYTYDNRGNISVDGAQQRISYNGYKLSSVRGPIQSVWGHGYLNCSYNGNNQPYNISLIDANTELYNYSDFQYDADYNRIFATHKHVVSPRWDDHGTLISGTTVTDNTLYYIDDRYEIKNYTRYLYIGGDAQSAVAVAEINGSNQKLWQIYRDEQGSIIAMADSAIVNRYYYTPWGRYCDSNGSTSSSIYANGGNMGNPFYRGFLGQEYYAAYGLINLNARMYNPFTGRFISADPVFNPSASLLGFNPYIYGNNCPGMYVDPDGELAFVPIIIMASFSGFVNIAANFDNIENGWQALGYFGAGAASGAIGCLTGGLGNGILAGMAIGAATSAATSFVTNGFNNLIAGRPFDFNMKSCVALGALTGACFGGIYGGLNAANNHCNIWTGKTKMLPMPESVKTGLSFDMKSVSLEKTPRISSGENFQTIDNLSLEFQNENLQFSKYITRAKELNIPQTPGNTYSVYVGKDANRIVRYVGITKRNPDERIMEHLLSKTDKAKLDYIVINGTGTLSKEQARFVEQSIINQYRLPRNGGVLYNKINSVSEEKWLPWGIK